MLLEYLGTTEVKVELLSSSIKVKQVTKEVVLVDWSATLI